MSEKLEACPFCGGAGEFLADIIGPGEVRCVDCDAMVRGDTGIGTIAAWNRRSHPGWAEEKKELQEAIRELQEDLMKATGGTMPSKRNAVHAMGWAEAIEAAAAEIEATPELTGFLKGRINAALRALHPSAAEPDAPKQEKT